MLKNVIILTKLFFMVLYYSIYKINALKAIQTTIELQKLFKIFQVSEKSSLVIDVRRSKDNDFPTFKTTFISYLQFRIKYDQ